MKLVRIAFDESLGQTIVTKFVENFVGGKIMFPLLIQLIYGANKLFNFVMYTKMS